MPALQAQIWRAKTGQQLPAPLGLPRSSEVRRVKLMEGGGGVCRAGLRGIQVRRAKMERRLSVTLGLIRSTQVRRMKMQRSMTVRLGHIRLTQARSVKLMELVAATLDLVRPGDAEGGGSGWRVWSAGLRWRLCARTVETMATLVVGLGLTSGSDAALVKQPMNTRSQAWIAWCLDNLLNG